ncbi:MULTISPECIES: SAM-dependent methyltransferase [Actinoalloteichus]|uniref:S-adenosyl methyltransferase n=1 Tax=Actinoalloteichus fjordicus TaxID=1612552 RepID=A0AAC9PV95_9PSEU|nr:MULTISPECIES: SAM-dependent methyltransferase [Actinoalloteichus]APU17840.1 S-adenosyl methyltransferase [Actinoalloteichus fjordicus]APU23918.1 S-adenosyl methyltransferase [Actinoalloteichus sp. GBA129-24]
MAGERPSWVPSEVDVERPSAARMYDYFLGGAHNFAVDRQMADQVIATFPGTRRFAQLNRSFLRWSVRLLLDAGVRQFIDLGSGIPTVGNVHETAQRIDPTAKVVYVDNDPVAYAHSRSILAHDKQAAVVNADLRDVDAVLTDPTVVDLLDLSEPVGLLTVAVLHFIPDADDPAATLAQYYEAVAAGSHLVVSHGLAEPVHEGEQEDERATTVKKVYSRSATPLTLRTEAQIAELFGDFAIIDPPGVVNAGLFSGGDLYAGPDPDWAPGAVGVGRKA